MRCILCHNDFEFRAGSTVLVLEHVAYGHDFVHAGACAETALAWIFPEPGYDCCAFSRDRERRRLVRVTPAEGWFTATLEPLCCWALIELADGTQRWEAIVRDEAWREIAGGAEFPSQQHYVFDTEALAA